MTTGQRFCPLCDKSFDAGEAVLRCSGCGVLHHPSCWVRNGGCATSSQHESAPVAMAYELEPPLAIPPLATGDVGRMSPQARAGEANDPVAFSPRPRPAQPRGTRQPPPFEPLPTEADDSDVIGADDIPPADSLPPPPILGAGPPVTRRLGKTPQRIQYATEGGRRPGKNAGAEMPSIYRRPRILQYWYVPVAAILAIGVAWGVVLAGDRLFGDDDTEAASGTTQTSTPPVTPTTSGAGAPPASTTARATGTAGSPTPSGTAPSGVRAVVAGTGGDCLNIRTGPGTSNPAPDCLDEGAVVTIVGEPEEADGLTWVHVISEAGHDGWVAEQYLERR